MNNPLSYAFYIYYSLQDYTNEILNPMLENKIMLSPFTRQSSLQTNLFQGRVEDLYGLVLMVVVRDNNGGIANFTKNIVV